MMIRRGQLARLNGAVPAIVALTSIWVVFHSAGIRVNASPSLPIGLYRTTSDPRAKLVEFCPSEPSAALSVSRGYRATGNCPDGAEPLMKPIVAKAGDAVALSHAGVAVNGKLLPNTAPLLFDTKNRPLAHWPFGKYLVARGNVWVVSSFNRRSFDSRYFGPIAVSSIRTRLRPIMTE